MRKTRPLKGETAAKGCQRAKGRKQASKVFFLLCRTLSIAKQLQAALGELGGRGNEAANETVLMPTQADCALRLIFCRSQASDGPWQHEVLFIWELQVLLTEMECISSSKVCSMRQSFTAIECYAGASSTSAKGTFQCASSLPAHAARMGCNRSLESRRWNFGP